MQLNETPESVAQTDLDIKTNALKAANILLMTQSEVVKQTMPAYTEHLIKLIAHFFNKAA
jgi:hypothetical protein